MSQSFSCLGLELYIQATLQGTACSIYLLRYYSEVAGTCQASTGQLCARIIKPKKSVKLSLSIRQDERRRADELGKNNTPLDMFGYNHGNSKYKTNSEIIYL